MKKPDRERLHYLDLLWRRRRIRAARASSKRQRLSIAKKRFTRPRRVRDLVSLSAPAEFSVQHSERRASLLRFLHRLTESLEGGSQVLINFDQTTTLSSGGTLLFVATIDKLLAKFPGRLASNYPANSTIEQMFQHIGLLKKLGNSPRLSITAENVKHWHFLCGETADLSGVKNLFNILATQLSDDTSSGLFDSISEAVTNVVQHAYEGVESSTESSSANNAPPRWWLFAQLKDMELQIAICDLGIGIPKSLKEKAELTNILPNIMRRLRKRKSSGMIEIAVESSRSRTKLPHRGKGLPDMLVFSRQAKIGGFLIYSHHGYFAYNAHFQSETARDFYPPVGGTVICWQLPLSP